MIRLGLDRIRRALAFLGHPEEVFGSVLVAGTNGKGSVSALVESAARAAGLRTGLFTSPHLVDVRERVRVGGVTIPLKDWRRLSSQVEDLSRRRRLALTEFERQTLLAFAWFASCRVDLAVVEVGLGGRLDAANTLPLPEVGVIASIGHDHKDWLGSTLRDVYFEKRGIARSGAPLVQAVSPALRREGVRDFRKRDVAAWTLGREINALHRGTDWARRRQCLDVFLPGADYQGVEIGLLGGHQVQNAALALAACHHLRLRGWPLTEAAIRDGFARASWPGRFHVVPGVRGRPDAVLDGAHNLEAARALAAAYRVSPWGRGPTTLVFGCLKDKDAAAMARILGPLAERVFLAPLPTPRARPTSELRRFWRGRDVREEPSAAEAVRRALAVRQTVLVAGSLYLVGEAMKVLGVKP